MPSGDPPFAFARMPRESWSTEMLRDHAATLRAAIADGVDPACVAPQLECADAILATRGAAGAGALEGPHGGTPEGGPAG